MSVESTAAAGSAARLGVKSAAVVLASLLLGGLTSFAQSSLGPLDPLANSSSGWTLLTALIIWFAREPTLPSAVFGPVSFVALVLGYTAAAALRGLTYNPLMFGVIGLVVGPFVGVAVAWLRCRGPRAAAGAALLSGIAVGEGLYGLIVVSRSTGWFYWTAIAVLGIALLVVTLVKRSVAARDVLLGAGGTALVAVAFYATYTSL